MSIKKIIKRLGLSKLSIRILNEFGLHRGYNSGDRILDVTLLIRRSRNKRAEPVCSSDSQQHFLFCGVIPGMSEHSLTTGLLAQALMQRGMKVSVLLCDRSIRACELVHFAEFSSNEEFINLSKFPKCDSCFLNSEKILSLLNIPIIKLSSLFNDSEFDEIGSELSHLSLEQIFRYRYKNIDIGEQVRTSVYRYFMKGLFDFSEDERRVALKYLASGIIYCNALLKFVLDNEINKMISVQGIYLLGGVTAELAKQIGLEYYAWDYSYRRNGVFFSHGSTYHHELRLESNSAWENISLSEEQNKILDEYFIARVQGSLDKDEISYTSESLLDPGRIFSHLKLSKDKPVIAIFSNVAWDGKVYVSSNIFDGPLELILETISHVWDHDHLQLVIRIHPAEVMQKNWFGLQRVDDVIRDRFGELPKHIKLILPEEKISSYGLVKLVKASVVYSTKLGLEAMLLGQQVIITGDALYGNKGFGIQPRSKPEFWNLIDYANSIRPLSTTELERARKYAYHFFFRRTFEVPSIYRYRFHERYIRKLTDLSDPKYSDLERLCRNVIQTLPLYE